MAGKPTDKKTSKKTGSKQGGKKKNAAKKKPAKGAAPKKAAKKGSGRKTPPKKKKPLGKRILKRLLIWTTGGLVGAALGMCFVLWVLYRQALSEIDHTLQDSVWEEAGRIVSGPMEIWPGLHITPDQLAGDLAAAGYGRSESIGRNGDFVVETDVITVREGRATVRFEFEGDRVSRVKIEGGGDSAERVTGEDGRAVLRSMELAGIRKSSEARIEVTLNQVPDHLLQAIVAVEDARFYEHEGVDPIGVVRAVLLNTFTDRGMQGGSTLTQQLVKNLFLTPERTLKRKIREALFAVVLERERSKEFILTLYLNEVYLGRVGGTAIGGVGQASKVFFGTTVERLSLGEAATLAGIISAPNRYSPLRHTERAQKRRDMGLERMKEVGYITNQQAARAMSEPLVVHAQNMQRTAPWAVDKAIEVVETVVGPGGVSNGVMVETSIQPALQRIAENAAKAGMADLAAQFPETAGAEVALVSVRVRDGAVVAMVGGLDYGKSQFDRSLHGVRQVGSTVKPLIVAWGFEQVPEMSPATQVLDEPYERLVNGSLWTPQNHDRKYVGPVSIRRAVADSRNVPAVVLAEEIGLEYLVEAWGGVGLDRAKDLPSTALGAFGGTPVELAGAYTVFPGQGRYRRPYIVTKAMDDKGEAIPAADTELWGAAGAQRVISRRAAFLATSVAEEVMRSGTGVSAGEYGIVGHVGGKTGTTDNAHDAWFVGFDRELVTAVWVGFDREGHLGVSGAKAALPIWARYMKAAGVAAGEFVIPDTVERIEVCSESLMPAIEECPEVIQEWFSVGVVPEMACSIHAADTGLAPAEEVIKSLRRGERPEGKRRGGVFRNKRKRR